MSTQERVVKVEVGEEDIAVQWNDGHQSIYDARFLRLNCGCAECVEEWSKRKILDPSTIPSDLQAEDHLMVGKYAIQFLWSDAHYTGIFPFTVLRDICSCELCSNHTGDS